MRRLAGVLAAALLASCGGGPSGRVPAGGEGLAEVAVEPLPAGAGETAPGAGAIEALSAWTFTDARGGAVRLSDLRGRAVVVSFVFTRCPVATMCPLVTQKTVRAARLLEDLADSVAFLLLTMDPEYDTPEVLSEYARVHGATDPKIRFLTGRLEDIRALADAFGVAFELGAEGEGVVSHNMRTTVLGPDGTVRASFRGADWDPGEVARAVRDALG